MKRLVFMIIPALCGLMFFLSCNKDEVNSALSIYAFGQSASTTKNATSEESEAVNQGLWCTGNDIKWYNGTTGELKLKNLPKLSDWTSFNGLSVFLDDVELFSLKMANPLSSAGLYAPYIYWERGEIVYSDCICGNKQDHIVDPNCGNTIVKQDPGRYFITYDYYHFWTQEAREQMASLLGQEYVDEIDKEKAAFEQGWDKFIVQLKKEGKYRK